MRTHWLLIVVASMALACAGQQCKSVDAKADRSCTPGAIDARVTQENIQTTICQKGYTATVRPLEAFTEALKRKQIKEYGYKDTRLAHYEEDHLIPLEVGGSPDDAKNLFPQTRKGRHAAAEKDQDENRLHREVCSGKTTLAAAQDFFRTRWTQ